MTAKAVIRLVVLSGKAAPSPAIGQALGPLGLNMMGFCKEFNERTKDHIENIPTPVILSAFANRTFKFELRTPPTTWFLKRCAGIEKGSAFPGRQFVGKVTVKEVYEIAKIKQQDSCNQHMSLEGMCRTVAGTAKTMGVDVVRD